MCNECAKTFKDLDREEDFIKHLHFIYKIMEIDEPHCKYLYLGYRIYKKSGFGTCKQCYRRIKFSYGVQPLIDHLKICQPDFYMHSRYVKKYFLYLLKRAKIELVLFNSFYIFLIIS